MTTSCGKGVAHLLEQPVGTLADSCLVQCATTQGIRTYATAVEDDKSPQDAPLYSLATKIVAEVVTAFVGKL